LRLLYFIVSNHPQFISKLKKFCEVRGLPLRKFWITLYLLRDTPITSEVAPHLLRMLAQSGLLDGGEESWIEKLEKAKTKQISSP